MNTSGRRPVAWVVIVRMNPVDEKQGILAKTEQQIKDEEAAMSYGTLVAVGPLAWKDEGIPRAEIGNEVMIRSYTGQYFIGEDKQKYRAVTDKDIICLVEKKDE